MWRDILLDNRAEVLPLIEALAGCVQELRAAVAAGDADAHRKAAGRGQGRTRSFHRGVTARWARPLARRSCASCRRWRCSLSACAETERRGAGPRRAGRAAAPTTASCGTWSPATATRVADVDLAALRASPWSRSLMQGSLDGEREERRAPLRLRRVHGGGAHAGRGHRGDGRAEHADHRARPLRRASASRSAFLARHAGRGRDAVAGQLAVGGAGAGGRAGHAAHDRAGRRPARARRHRRRVGRRCRRGRRPAGRASPRAGRRQESARGDHRDLGDGRHAGARRGDARASRRAAAGRRAAEPGRRPRPGRRSRCSTAPGTPPRRRRSGAMPRACTRGSRWSCCSGSRRCSTA